MFDEHVLISPTEAAAIVAIPATEDKNPVLSALTEKVQSFFSMLEGEQSKSLREVVKKFWSVKAKKQRALYQRKRRNVLTDLVDCCFKRAAAWRHDKDIEKATNRFVPRTQTVQATALSVPACFNTHSASL